jgi:hypothetical protein
MDTTLQRRSLPPVAALIGALVALRGITAVLHQILSLMQMRFYQGKELAFSQHYNPNGWWWISFLLGLLFVAAGVGLLRGARWARLGAMAAMTLDIVHQLLEFLWPYFHDLIIHKLSFLSVVDDRLSYLSIPALFLRLAAPLVMLLFLTLPAVRHAWQDERGVSPDWLNRWGQALEKRLPSGLPTVAAFIAVYLFCLGLSQIFLMLPSVPSLWQVMQQHTGLVSIFCLVGDSLYSVGYVVAGAALLWQARWAKRAALAALGISIFYSLFILFLMNMSRNEMSGYLSASRDYLGKMLIVGNLLPYFAALIAIDLIIAIFLLRAMPRTERVAEEVT